MVPPAVKLGITVRDLLPTDRLSLVLPPTTTGVLITGVEPGSPADTVSQMTGITLNGAVLQKLGRKTITTKADLTQAVAGLSSGSSLTLVILYSDRNQVHQSAVTIRL
jgi:S1-C subfamily serine protease